jgi:hypothetical protein
MGFNRCDDTTAIGACFHFAMVVLIMIVFVSLVVMVGVVLFWLCLGMRCMIVAFVSRMVMVRIISVVIRIAGAPRKQSECDQRSE